MKIKRGIMGDGEATQIIRVLTAKRTLKVVLTSLNPLLWA
jgi:hypothetical protein